MSQVKKSNVQRRPRILAIQKKLLVQLVENHFVRMTGQCSNVNFEAIEPSAFDRFAEILNSWGVTKTSSQWRSSFYYMKNRIRRSVEMILKSNASVKDNLSDLDFKLYSMSPSWFHGAIEDGLHGVELNNDFGDTEGNISSSDFVKEETSGIGIGDIDFVNYSDGHNHNAEQQTADVVEDEINDFQFGDDFGHNEDKSDDVGEGQYHRHDHHNESDSGNFVSESSRRILVADNAEELENFIESSIILSDDEEPIVSQRTVTESQPENYDTEALEHYRPPSFSGKLQRAPKERQTQVGCKIPELQKERLIQLVQNGFVKAFGRFTGANGAYIKAQFWESTAKELNTMGPPRTGTQWRTTFNSIKASAKSKLADDHNNVGGLVTKPLTRLEEKVLSIYGMNALDGIQDLGEAGFKYQKTVPVRRRVCESTVTSGALENLSKSTESRDATFEGPTDSGIENSNSDSLITPEGSHEVASSDDDRDGGLGSSNDISIQNYPEMLDETSNLERGNSTSYRNRGHSSYRRSSPFHHHNSNSSNEYAAGTTAATPVGNRSPRQSGIRDQQLNTSRSQHRFNFQSQNSSSSSSQLRMNSANPSRGSSRPDDSGRSSRMPPIGSSYSQRPRGASYDVRGVPRRNVRRPVRRSSSDEQIEEITNINQLFSDGGRDSLDEDHGLSRNESTRGNTGSRSRRMNDGNADQTVARVERDRSNLRHRFTSFEMVQRSMDAQERFIEDNNRNHSELMYVTDRNHMEMLSIFNATLRTLSNVADKFVNKM